MLRSPAKLAKNLCLTALLLLAVTPARSATTNRWIGPGSGLWRDAANWAAGQAPNSTFTYTLITNSGTKTVTIDAATPVTNLTIQRLTIAAPAGSINTLALLDVPTNTPLLVSTPLTIGAGGALAITNSALSLSGFSGFDIVDSSATLAGGRIDCASVQAVRLGRNSGATGRLAVTGGTMITPQVELGAAVGAQGLLDISGGVLNASGLLQAGYAVGSTGVVSISNGQLIATNDISNIGNAGFGQMDISGGSAAFAFLSIGDNADGVVAVSGGQLNVLPRSATDWMRVGNLGTGQLSVSGGTLTVRSELHLGDDVSGTGIVSFTGGQLIATNEITAIGRIGSGTMTVSNATLWMTNVSVGRHDGSVGSLVIQSNAQVYLLDALSVGRFSNSVGHLTIDGGLLSLTNDVIWVGREGTGDMAVSGGTVQAKGMNVAVSTVTPDPNTGFPTTNTPAGSLSLSNGDLLLSSNLVVGTENISTGLVVMAGGNLIVTNQDHTAYLNVSGGSFTLAQGSVVTDQLLLTNVAGQFLFTGGTMEAGEARVSNGSPFVVGDGSTAATFRLKGGTYVFADGLVISSNATLTGCGTIVGTVSGPGTISTNCGPVRPDIVSVAKTDTTVAVAHTSSAGSSYILEYKNVLTDTAWAQLPPAVPGTGTIMTNYDNTATVQSRFYRIGAQ